jgi:proline racemase
LLKEAHVGSIQAEIPEIAARDFTTAIQEFKIHPDDPLKYGFSL